MSITRLLLTAAFLIGSMLAVSSSTIYAALPCNLNDQIVSTEFADEPNRDPVVQPFMETFAGVRQADRDGSTEITYDSPHALRFRLVSAGENILRCLDYGQDEVLVINATPRYRYAQFGVKDEVPEGDLISDLGESGVYTERVENPQKLANGFYLVDFTARHNDLWMSGEMVFEEIGGDFYLNATWLDSINPAKGESHRIETTNAGISVDELVVENGDTIGFPNERDENIDVVISSNETGDIVFRGGNMGKNFVGPAPKSTYYVQNLEPGTYTASITTDGGDVFEVQITVEP